MSAPPLIQRWRSTKPWLRASVWLGLAVGLLVILPEISPVRSLLARPLIVHDAEASGDAAYVLAGGNAFRERLEAAADLVHLGRVPVIYLTANHTRGRYHFPSRTGRQVMAWDLDYLRWLGIDDTQVRFIEPGHGARLHTLDEARQMARAAERDGVRRLVVISSPAHMRRAMMAFRHALPVDVQVKPFAARRFIHSVEADRPLWREYLKLAIYAVAVAVD